MKILFVASNSEENDPLASLNLIREVTELQARYLKLGNVDFAFMPDLPLEGLPSTIREHRPDVLHIAAHGNDKNLSFSNSSGKAVAVDADVLRAILQNQSLKLVYLNSCDSHGIAESLVASKTARVAIGTSATISNHAARTAAVTFYENILAGRSVYDAFEQCDSMLKALNGGAVRAKVFAVPGLNLNEEILRPTAQLVAQFIPRGTPKRSRDGFYSLMLGVRGCPIGTAQVTFVSDNVTVTQRASPIAGAFWATEHIWLADEEHRVLALGLKDTQGSFLVSGTICEAIERYFVGQGLAIPHNGGRHTILLIVV
jgi:CHAT domain